MNFLYLIIFAGVLIFSGIVWIKLFYTSICAAQNTAVIVQKTSNALNGLSQAPIVIFTRKWVGPSFLSRGYTKTIVDLSLLTVDFDLREKHSIRCKDFIRVNIQGVFYMHIEPSTEHVLLAVNTLGATKVADPQAVKEHFTPLLTQALQTEIAKREFYELFTNRNAFCQSVIQSVVHNLSGYELLDISIDYLDQIPLSELDPENFEDAQAIAKIKQREAKLQLESQQMELKEAKARAKRDAYTQYAKAELERQTKEV